MDDIVCMYVMYVYMYALSVTQAMRVRMYARYAMCAMYIRYVCCVYNL